MDAKCDHCDQPTDRDEGHQTIVWCGQCIADNIKLLDSLDLDGFWKPSSGSFGFSDPENVRKLRAIPKKQADQQPVAIATPVPTPVVSTPAPIQPAFDFDKYNRTLPGGRAK